MQLDHVVFPVRDAGATLRFYRDVLGLPLIDALSGPDWGGHPWLMMMFGLESGQEIVCVALNGAAPPDYAALPEDVRHYALALGSLAELESWKSRLEAANIRFWEERHGERASVYFPDPDGVILEFTYPPASGSHARAHSSAAQERVKAWIEA